MYRVLSRSFIAKIEEVEAHVYEILRHFPKVSPDLIKKTSSLKELNLDSLDTIDLILDLEDRFHTHLHPSEVLKVHTVLDLISIFHKYQ